MLGANLLALAVPSEELFNLVFLLDGVYDAATLVSGLNILLELAPAPDERPTYVGLGRTAVAPIAFGAPLAAGLLADAAGFAVVFSLAALFSLGALALLIGRVHEPRRGPLAGRR